MFQISAQVLPIKKCDAYDEEDIFLSTNPEEDNLRTELKSFQPYPSSFIYFK